MEANPQELVPGARTHPTFIKNTKKECHEVTATEQFKYKCHADFEQATYVTHIPRERALCDL